MAQQVTDTTEAQKVMREILDPKVYTHFEQNAPFIGLWPDGSAEFIHDRGIEWVVYLQPNPSMNFLGDGGSLPQGSTSKKQRMKATPTTFSIARRLTGQILHTDRESIVKGLTPMVQEDSDTFTKAMNVFAYGTGDARLATVSAAPAGTAAITMTQPLGCTLLWERGKYNIVDPADGTKRTMTIGSVALTEFYLVANSPSTDVASFADDEGDTVADNITATTIVAGDIVVFADSYGIAFHGTGYHLNNTGTYQNLSRTTYSKQIVPGIKDALNGPVTVGLMDFIETQVALRKGGKKVLDGLFWNMSFTQLYGYRSLGYNTDTKVVKQVAGSDMKLDLGYTVVEHNGRQINLDTDCPPDIIDLLDRSSFRKCMAKKPGLIDDDGKVLHMIPAFSSSGGGTFKWQYLYFLSTIMELVNKDILNNGRLKNLSTQDLPTRRF